MTEPKARFVGTNAFITGGGGGIGAEVALRLASEGAAIFVADQHPDAAEEVVERVRALGARAEFTACDVTNEDEVEKAFSVAQTSLGPLGVFVGLAGILEHGSIIDLDREAWDRVLSVNLTGMFLSCKHAVRALLANGGGAIVTMGSVAGVVERKSPRAPSYGVTKAGIISLTRSIAVNFAEDNIRANCICPGNVETNFVKVTSSITGLPNRSPMARNAQANEIAGAIAFLASEDASYMTGAVLMVDGGLTAV